MHDDAMQRLRAANPITGSPAVRPVDELIASWSAALSPEFTYADPPVGAADPRLDGADSASGAAGRVARRRSPWRTTGLSVVLALAVGTGSAAAALTAFTGHPIPQSPDTVSVRPAAGSTHVSDVRAVDPDGGAPWALRVGAAAGGLQCLGVGQVDDGRFGLVGLDGVFREVAPAGGDDCGVAPGGTRSTIEVRTFLGKRSPRDVTVIYGVRGPGIRSVRVQYVDGVAATLPIGRDGAFVVARRGTLDQLRPTVQMQPSAKGSHFSYVATLGTPLPASRAGCGTPGHRSVSNCRLVRPLIPSEGIR